MSSINLARVNESIKLIEVDESQVLLDCRTNLVIKLNKTGSSIWNALTEELSWEDVICRVQLQTGGLESEVATAVKEFAERLQKEGWIFLNEELVPKE